MNLLTNIPKSLCLFTLVLLAAFGCQQQKPSEEDESVPISSDFILQTDASIDNRKDLNGIQRQIDDLLNRKNNFASIGDEDLKNAKKVKLVAALATLFDPDQQPCPLPNKVLRKLNKLKANKKAWAPKFVKEQVAIMADSAYFLPGTSLSSLLHTVIIKRSNGRNFDWTVVGSPTFKNLNVEDYILTAAFNSFIYTLDCSGYLNAAIEGSGVVPGADIKASAASSVEKQNSMFIGGGILISPLCAAIYGQQVGVEIDTLERIKILNALVSIPDIGENDTIDTALSYEVIWSSKRGSSSFNGRGVFSAKGGVGVGIAQVSASGNAGGTIARQSSFSSFETYVTKEQKIKLPKKIVVKDVKTLIQNLKKKPLPNHP